MSSELQEKGLFSKEGALLAIGAAEGFDRDAASSDGVMTGVNVIFTEWVFLPGAIEGISFENLWSGDPTAAFIIEIRNKGPAQPSGFDISANDPDATSYGGDLSLDDLSEEDLGVSAVQVSGFAVAAVRMKCTNALGNGVWNCRVRGTKL